MNDFSDLAIAPSQQFSERLEALLLDDLGWGDAASSDEEDSDPSDVLLIGDAKARQRRRPWRVLSVAAATVIVVATIAINAGGQRPQIGPNDTVLPTTSSATPTSTTAPTTSTSVQVPQAPPGELVPGNYRIAQFAVPFTFSIGSDWFLDKRRTDLVALITMTGPRLALTTGLLEGATAADIEQSICPGVIDFEPAQSATLLGQPAVQMVGTGTGPCAIELAADVSSPVDRGSVVQVTVAIVDGQVITAIAGALAPMWAQTEADVAELLASIQPIS